MFQAPGVESNMAFAEQLTQQQTEQWSFWILDQRMFQAPGVKSNMAFGNRLTQQQTEQQSSAARCAPHMVEPATQQAACERCTQKAVVQMVEGGLKGKTNGTRISGRDSCMPAQRIVGR